MNYLATSRRGIEVKKRPSNVLLQSEENYTQNPNSFSFGISSTE